MMNESYQEASCISNDDVIGCRLAGQLSPSVCIAFEPRMVFWCQKL